ncbi:universal stress protein [Roseovarius sp. TE539]|uniref:universal stress protein n=1 Tax=Roseovarius sp. TE539 TaxID=2249812 RepID=UPI000DDF4D32|nr:universal stress protein [Roseovarius sp. TE539]RBI68346.1 universal stress protein [Roseovarius sp. TE539]
MKKHILVATDGSDTAMQAVDLAAELAAKFDAKLTIGHVHQFGRPAAELSRMAEVEHIAEHVSRETQVDFRSLSGSAGDLFGPSRPKGDVVRAITLVGEEVLRRAADRARDKGVKDVDTATSQGDAADAIIDMAEENGADMIVVGHRGLGRLRRMLQGSVAQKVTQQAEVTVVSVR